MTSSTADKYTTTEYGKQNMFAAEAQPWIDEKDTNYDHWAVAEQTNGRLAMIAFMGILAQELVTGQNVF